MRKFLSFVVMFVACLSVTAQSGLPAHYHCVTSGVNNGLLHPSVTRRLLFIYNQSEIAAMTTPVTGSIAISRIFFRTNNAGTANYTGLTIRMGHTTLSNATTSTTYATNFNVGGPATVYSGAASFVMTGSNSSCATGSTWFYLDLQSAFTYNFVNNLCVEIIYTSQTGTIPSFYAVNPGGGVNPTAITASTSGAATGTVNARPMFGFSSLVLNGNEIHLEMTPQEGGSILRWNESASTYTDFRMNITSPNGQVKSQDVHHQGEMKVDAPQHGLYQAQLFAIDEAGAEVQSKILRWQEEGTILVYPQPWQGRLYVELPLNGCQLSVLDAKGKLMYHLEDAERVSAIENDLPLGVYILRIKMPDGKLVYRKLQSF